MAERLGKYEDWARACIHVRCGLCRENCPAYSQLRLDSYSAKGKLTMMYHWLKGGLQPDEVMADRVFACTSCGLCDVACGYEQSTAIQDMKAALLESGISPPKGYVRISQRTKETGNPYAEAQDVADAYLETIPETRLDSADFTLFLGCTEIYREQEQVDSVLRILKGAKVSFNVISQNICCGSPTYRVGNDAQARVQAERVMSLFSDQNTSSVLASCSGCYRMFVHDYPSLIPEGVVPPVLHTVQLIDRLLSEKKLKPRSLKAVVTYHDPCHLGRHAGIYDEPRRIIQAIPGLELVEMEWSHRFSKCCGAGGGFRSGREEDAIAIAARRVQEAESVGATILLTACPFCLRNLTDGAEGIGSDIKIRTVESLLAEQL
jgi:heterodisulfide reductase subunit D